MVWEIVFMLVILKIPIAYLCGVVYWAIRSEPPGPEEVEQVAWDDAPPWKGPGWARRPRPRRGAPRGGPSRTYARTRRSALARAELDR